jgi:AcrR family transcriptional regulator
VVRDVLSATVAEFVRVGYAALRVEDVAAAAGVNKTTVYRRWPTKGQLVLAALRYRVPSIIDLPDLGSLRADLLELLRHYLGSMSAPEGRAIARMMITELAQPEVAALAAAFRSERLDLWSTLFVRAIERGELPQGTNVRLLAEVLSAALFSKVKLNEPMSEAYFAAVIEIVLVGAEHGGAVNEQA